MHDYHEYDVKPNIVFFVSCSGAECYQENNLKRKKIMQSLSRNILVFLGTNKKINSRK
jgi:hypothetical protein